MMMEEKNDSKKIILSVLGVAILIVAVVGISFAAFNYSNTSNNANSIQTGTIMMSYSEPVNGILLQNALPMSDGMGSGLTEAGQFFEFTVSTTATGALTIPYEITITPIEIVASETVLGGLSANQVKVNLTKNGTQVVSPTLVSELVQPTTEGRKTDSLHLYNDEDVYASTTGGSTTTTYVLRMWISDTVSAADIAGSDGKHYEYRLKVNVDSTVSAIGA